MPVEALVQELNEMNARQLARWLTTPARSGFFFSSADLQRLASRIGLRVSPHGRAAGVEELLRGAALDDRLDEALAFVEGEMSTHLGDYRSVDLPELERWTNLAALTLEAWTMMRASVESEE